jgi:hypothetical protein
MIARPARVAMRARNPCRRFRRRTFGWKVRFTETRPAVKGVEWRESYAKKRPLERPREKYREAAPLTARVNFR